MRENRYPWYMLLNKCGQSYGAVTAVTYDEFQFSSLYSSKVLGRNNLICFFFLISTKHLPPAFVLLYSHAIWKGLS